MSQILMVCCRLRKINISDGLQELQEADNYTNIYATRCPIVMGL